MLKKFFLIGLLCLLTGGCGGIKVQHDYDPGVDFSQLKSYGWQPSDELSPSGQSEDLTERKLMQAVEAELQAKGVVPDNANPDILLSLSSSKRKVYGGSVGIGASVGVPVGSRGYVSLGGGRSAPREKTEGGVALDIFSAESQKLIWQATASATRSQMSSPEEQNRYLQEVASKLLANFPPKK